MLKADIVPGRLLGPPPGGGGAPLPVAVLPAAKSTVADMVVRYLNARRLLLAGCRRQNSMRYSQMVEKWYEKRKEVEKGGGLSYIYLRYLRPTVSLSLPTSPRQASPLFSE